MDPLNSPDELLRITERYRQMTDEELLLLVPQSSELTPLAQQALASEVRQRRLKVEVQQEDEKPAPPWLNPSVPSAPWFNPGASSFNAPDFRRRTTPEPRNLPDENSDDDEDRKLVELCTVWSARDALQMQTILDNVGIPFFMGPEKATGVDTVTSDFSKGVGVQIMHIGLPWALEPMKNYFPADDPTPQEKEEPEELDVRCPKCHSTEVVFDELIGEQPKSQQDSPQKFRWTCDSCGNEWQDDGIAKED